MSASAAANRNSAHSRSLSQEGFVRRVERVMREGTGLRCQDLKGHFLLLGGLRHQTTEACRNRQQQYGSSHEVEDAVDLKVFHQALTNQRAEYRANTAHQNEPSAYRDDTIRGHAIKRVGDADRIQC